MNKRDIVIGIFILVILAGVIYWRQRTLQKPETKVPATLSTQQQIEEKFNIKIPEDVNKSDLKDVSGGNGLGIATRKLENGKYYISVLADLPDPETGSFYEAWLMRGKAGEDNYSIISIGKIRLAKGGWILNYESSKDLKDYNNVVISQEKSADNNIEKTILIGSF